MAGDEQTNTENDPGAEQANTGNNDAAAQNMQTNSTSQQQQSSLSRLFSNYSNRHPNNHLFADQNESDLSSDDDEHGWSQMNSIARSLPFFFGMRDLKCFVCNKLIPADDVETHIMMCLTKPRITYNGNLTVLLHICILNRIILIMFYSNRRRID